MSSPEGSAREDIDRQLTAARRAVQDVAGINLSAFRGVAVRELRSQGLPADFVIAPHDAFTAGRTDRLPRSLTERAGGWRTLEAASKRIWYSTMETDHRGT